MAVELSGPQEVDLEKDVVDSEKDEVDSEKDVVDSEEEEVKSELSVEGHQVENEKK